MGGRTYIGAVSRDRPTDPTFVSSEELLARSTAQGARGIFVRFVLVVLGINLVIGGAVVAFDIWSSVRETRESLESSAKHALYVADRLHAAQPDLPLGAIVTRASELTGMPMALLDARGEVVTSTSPKLAGGLRVVYGSHLSPGIRYEIREDLGEVSGAWMVRPFLEGARLVVVVPHTVEDEGRVEYFTISAGVLALGEAFTLLAMLLSANWILRRPLARLVNELTSALARDVQRRQLAEQSLHAKELQLLQRARLASLGEMATGVAHELSQPLNNIGLLASRVTRRALDDQPDPAFVQDKLQKIQGQVQRASRLIDQLRAFGRPAVHNMALFPIDRPVHAVLDLLQQQLQNRGIAVKVDIPADLPQACGDEAQLEQVLINLINNARDALEDRPADPSCPAIELTAEAVRPSADAEAEVHLRVADNGPGIPSSVAERVFEPFFTTKEVGKGTGLGLSISYALVRGFGGRLELSSIPGGWTTFTLLLKTTLVSATKDALHAGADDPAG